MEPGVDPSAIAEVGSGPPLPPGRFESAREAIREEGALGVLIAVLSTVVVFGVLVWVIGHSDAWPQVHEQFFSGEDFRASWPDVLSGFWVNMKLFAVSQVLILGFALLVAVIRSLRGAVFFPLRLLAVVYIDLFRGTPKPSNTMTRYSGMPRKRSM